MKRSPVLAGLLVLMLAPLPACADDGEPESAGLRDALSHTQQSLHVSSGDALWNVAKRVKPAAASVEQVMLALVAANPEAFPSGNINDMNANAELRVPGVARMLSRSKAQAIQTIDYMNIAWRIRGPNGPVHVPLGPEDAAAQQTLADRTRKPALPVQDTASLDADAAALAARLGRLSGQDEREAMQIKLERITAQRDRLRDEVTRLKTEMTRLTEELALQEVELARREVRERAAPGGAGEQGATGQGAPVAPASELAVARRGMLSLAAQYRWPLVAGALVMVWLGWRYRRRFTAGFAPSRGEQENAARSGEKVAFTPSSQDNTRSFS